MTRRMTSASIATLGAAAPGMPAVPSSKHATFGAAPQPAMRNQQWQFPTCPVGGPID